MDIALAINADGLHIGQEDLPATVARNLIGPHKLLGVSASTIKEAVDAEKAGADYIGVGAMYSTKTKTDAMITSFSELEKIVATVSIPIVVIGGINYETMKDFQDINISGFAIVSDIIASKDIVASSRRLKYRADEILK